MTRGTRGAYRKEDRIALPLDLQREIVEKAAAKYGNCQELAKHLEIPKSSVHYYRVGRLTMPQSILQRMLDIAGDDDLKERVSSRGITKDRTWANEYAVSVYREICRNRVRLPTEEELEKDDNLRRKAASIVSYVMAEGSIWFMKREWGELAANVTLGSDEADLYDHFRSLCRTVLSYDIGPPRKPGNCANAIRGFLYSRFAAQWLVANGVPIGDKAAVGYHLPSWVMQSQDDKTWCAALQPWFDGEGHVIQGNGRIVIGQSRHSDLDFHVLSHKLCRRGASRYVNVAELKKLDVFGMSAYDYLMATSRSEVFDDVIMLIRRLGIDASMGIANGHLKDNGFWSANWTISIPRRHASRVLALGLLSQRNKVGRLRDSIT